MNNLQLRNGELITLGARAGHGKTTFVCSILSQFASRGYKTLLVSLEMPKNTLKIDNRVSVLDFKHLNRENGKNYLGKLENYLVGKKYRLIAIDYIQLMDGKIEQNVWTIKQLALRLNIPIIILSQLNRKALESDIANEGNLSKSDFICHTSDQIWLIEPYFINVVKNRRGKTFKYPVYFDKENRKFFMGENPTLKLNGLILHQFFEYLGTTRRLKRAWDKIVQANFTDLANGTIKFLKSWYKMLDENWIANSRGAFNWSRFITGKISKWQASACLEIAEIFDPKNDNIDDILTIMSKGEL